MSNLFGRSLATPSSSSAKLTKRKVALAPSGSAYHLNTSPTTASCGGTFSSPVSLVTTRTSLQHGSTHHPHSQTEVYWAVRALRSEGLLAAQTTHHNEVRAIISFAESRRAREIYELKREHDARHFRLEAVALGLFLWLIFLAIIVFYLLANFSRQRITEGSRWSLPHHFTIPVLSPFTSVVETESSAIGAQSIAVLIVVSGACIYGLIKYWLNRRSME